MRGKPTENAAAITCTGAEGSAATMRPMDTCCACFAGCGTAPTTLYVRHGSDAKARPKRHGLSPVLKLARSVLGVLLRMLQAERYLLGIMLQRLQARRHEFTDYIWQSDIPKHYSEGIISGMDDPPHNFAEVIRQTIQAQA